MNMTNLVGLLFFGVASVSCQIVAYAQSAQAPYYNVNTSSKYSNEIVTRGQYTYDVCVLKTEDKNGKTSKSFLREDADDGCAGLKIGESYARFTIKQDEFIYSQCFLISAEGNKEYLGEMPVPQCRGL